MSEKLAGAMVWSVETDDFRGICGKGVNPLLNTVRKSLGLPLLAGQGNGKSSSALASFHTPRKPDFPIPKSSASSLSLFLCQELPHGQLVPRGNRQGGGTPSTRLRTLTATAA